MTVSLPPVIKVNDTNDILPAIVKVNDEVFKVEA